MCFEKEDPLPERLFDELFARLFEAGLGRELLFFWLPCLFSEALLFSFLEAGAVFFDLEVLSRSLL